MARRSTCAEAAAPLAWLTRFTRSHFPERAEAAKRRRRAERAISYSLPHFTLQSIVGWLSAFA